MDSRSVIAAIHAEVPTDDVRALSALVHALRGALVAAGVVKGGA